MIFKSLEDGDSPWGGGTLGSVIRALVVDPQSPSTLYAFDDNSAGSNAGYLDKSTDGGATWTRMPVPPLMKGGLAIDPSAPSVLYADADGPFQTRGVFKTTNGGMSWTFTGLAKRTPALAIDPQVPTTVYAGTASEGVFKTTDGGASWIAASDGLTTLSVLTLAIDPQSTSTLYAATRGSGVSKSSDGGEHWFAASTGLPAVDVYALAIDPQIPSILYAGTYGAGVFASSDGGATWNAMNAGLTNLYVRALALDPRIPTNLYAGTDGTGVFAMTMTPRFDLTVERAGDGGGVVTSAPDGITCGDDCSESYLSGTTVTLEAVPAADSVFTGWSGCDASEDTICTVTMDAARSVTPGFDLKRFVLTVGRSGIGSGTVTSSPEGIDCGSDCYEPYVIGTSVTLTATAHLGAVTGWTGCESESHPGITSTCTVTMTEDRSVTANFVGAPPLPFVGDPRLP